MERNLLRQRVLEGVKAARARGRKGGRPRIMTLRAAPHGRPDTLDPGHPRAGGRCLEFLHERCRYPDMEDDLERPVCSFCGARAQSPVPQGWFSAELEHVVDEDEEVAAVEVWEAVACADCEGQIRMTAEHLEAQGWQPIPGPL